MINLEKKRQLKLIINQALSSFLDLIFPHSCIGCEKEGTFLCNKCFNSIPTILANHCPFCEKKTIFGNVCDNCKKHHFLDGAISAIPYSNELVLTMIHLWKYDGFQEMTQYLARFVSQSITIAQHKAKSQTQKLLTQGLSSNQINDISSIPAILTKKNILLQPIPLHDKRKKERGFNQAYLLAKDIAQNFKTFHLVNFIKRTKNTIAQATLAGTDRSINMINSFALHENYTSIAGKHIVLVDDVITTANTSDACAKLLKNAGAESVWTLTIAYGHPIKKQLT